VQIQTSFLLRRLYDNLNKLQDGQADAVEFRRAVEDFADAIDVYEKDIDISLKSLEDKDHKIKDILEKGDGCKNIETKDIWDRMIITQINPMSNMLGYLAALVAFAEFADGNRESALRLIDKRIEDEIKNTHQ
jgi:hypothetical protein